MKNLVSRKHILLYFILTVAFACLFQWIKPYYSPDLSPIDSRALTYPFHFFDKGYVIEAKTGYNIPHYYRSFFVIDLFFPVLYTLLSLSILQLVKERKIYPLLRFMAFAACCFDYMENFSFAIFLQLPGNGLAPVVAAATAIKSILVSCNLLTGLGIILASIFK